MCITNRAIYRKLEKLEKIMGTGFTSLNTSLVDLGTSVSNIAAIIASALPDINSGDDAKAAAAAAVIEQQVAALNTAAASITAAVTPAA
jgi:hypothetical protein